MVGMLHVSLVDELLTCAAFSFVARGTGQGLSLKPKESDAVLTSDAKQDWRVGAAP